FLSFTTPYSKLYLLDIAHNKLTDAGILDILNSIKKAYPLGILYVWGNSITRTSCKPAQEQLDVRVYTVDNVDHVGFNNVDRYKHIYYCLSEFGCALPKPILRQPCSIIPTQLIHLDKIDSLCAQDSNTLIIAPPPPFTPRRPILKFHIFIHSFTRPGVVSPPFCLWQFEEEINTPYQADGSIDPERSRQCQTIPHVEIHFVRHETKDITDRPRRPTGNPSDLRRVHLPDEDPRNEVPEEESARDYKVRFKEGFLRVVSPLESAPAVGRFLFRFLDFTERRKLFKHECTTGCIGVRRVALHM
ncbi:unnamed protein product, partial [Timema podura]|nr:unnamed protein product [Timema podura]